MSKEAVRKTEIPVISRPRTERKYERVHDAYDLCRIIAKHGDRTAFTYYDKSKKLYSISYIRFYNRIARTAAGLTRHGLAGKKIAIIGETSVAWIASYIAVLVTGGIAIPVDKELEISAIVGLLAVCAVFAAIVNFVKDGLNTWTTVILKDQFGFGDSISIILSLVMPLCGVFGSVIAMQGNKLIKEFRALIGVMYLILSALLLGVVWALKIDSVVMTVLFFGVVSCMTNAINTVMLSIMPLTLRDRVNTGFLAGFMNACCYAGSAVSAYGLGKIADGKSWTFVICVLLVTTVVATVLAGASVLLRKSRKEKIS